MNPIARISIRRKRNFRPAKRSGRPEKKVHLPWFIIGVGLSALILKACTTEFVPEVHENKELVVVEGLITDQPGPYVVKLSKSTPFGEATQIRPLTDCIVSVTDDQGNTWWLNEAHPGVYLTDSAGFRGETGRTYTLHIGTPQADGGLHYVSDPMLMQPVPPIDSVYYEKIVIQPAHGFFKGTDGCQIYLDTHDPNNSCRYYRWDFQETWEILLLFTIENKRCWVSDTSGNINIKSTAAFSSSVIERHPVTFISNNSDRLKNRYSILVNQYSLNEDEYNFWQRLQNLNVEVGGLYDMIPASIPSNLYCQESADQKVLGYFSVSARTSKRIFIQDNFAGIVDPYAGCITDTVGAPVSDDTTWVLISHVCSFPCQTYYLVTHNVGCTDCTLRGTKVRPKFWTGD